MIGTRAPVGKGETTAGLENVPEAAYRGHMTGPGEPLRPPAPAVREAAWWLTSRVVTLLGLETSARNTFP